MGSSPSPDDTEESSELSSEEEAASRTGSIRTDPYTDPYGWERPVLGESEGGFKEPRGDPSRSHSKRSTDPYTDPYTDPSRSHSKRSQDDSATDEVMDMSYKKKQAKQIINKS